MELKSNPVKGVKIISDYANAIKQWTVRVKGPSNSVYEGGYFRVNLIFDRKYPKVLPECKFITKIYHPQVKSNGLSIFWYHNEEKQTARTLLYSLRSQLKQISNDEEKYVDQNIAFEMLHDYKYFSETA